MPEIPEQSGGPSKHGAAHPDAPDWMLPLLRRALPCCTSKSAVITMLTRKPINLQIAAVRTPAAGKERRTRIRGLAKERAGGNMCAEWR